MKEFKTLFSVSKKLEDLIQVHDDLTSKKFSGWKESQKDIIVLLDIDDQISESKKQKLLDIFFNQYTSYYTYDLIYSLPAFTDCHALDASRSRFMFLKNYTQEYSNYKEKILGNWSKKQDLDVMDHDNFINKYIKHKKGNK